MKDGQAQKDYVMTSEATTDLVEIHIVPNVIQAERYVLNAMNSEGVANAMLVRIAERIG